MNLDLPTRRSTIRLAARLAPLVRASDFIVLTGDLGTGKTFFVRALCRALGVPPAMEVTSPTFTLVHELAGRIPIVHADAYRLRDEAELLAIGLREARSEGALLLLEWGAPYVDVLGGDALLIALEHGVSPSARRAALRAEGPRGAELLALLDGDVQSRTDRRKPPKSPE